jgi:hypothetical protein
MDLKPSFLAIRSIAAEFARRLYVPAAVSVAIVALLAIALAVWLVTINEWWLILLITVCGMTFFAFMALAVAFVVIKKVTPLQSKIQKKQTKAFVDKLLRVAEVTSTPKIFLLFQVMKDVVRPSREGFISSVSNDTGSLKRDFVALKDSFHL